MATGFTLGVSTEGANTVASLLIAGGYSGAMRGDVFFENITIDDIFVLCSPSGSTYPVTDPTGIQVGNTAPKRLFLSNIDFQTTWVANAAPTTYTIVVTGNTR